jgi:hypothetical protein
MAKEYGDQRDPHGKIVDQDEWNGQENEHPAQHLDLVACDIFFSTIISWMNFR